MPPTSQANLTEHDLEVLQAVDDFRSSRQEWRRLFSEWLGTFFLVLVAAGATMVGRAFPDTIDRAAAVVAPGIMVMSVILFMGHVSGAHLNPAVTLAFAVRSDFPWRRVPGYVVVQLAGALCAAWLLQAVLGVSSSFGATFPGPGVSDPTAMVMEAILTFGLVSVILGTSSGAQNIGIVAAFGVGGYIALAGLWASPVTGASMNPARSLGPGLVAADPRAWWVYVAGPLLGALAATGAAVVLRGRGGGIAGSRAAQGLLHTEVEHPNQV